MHTKNHNVPLNAIAAAAIGCLSLLAGSCRAKTDMPEGLTSDGRVLDQTLPRDQRLFDLFSNLSIIDHSKEPAYKKCTYNYFTLDTATKTFTPPPEGSSSTDSFTYDAQGRKIKQIYEYGSASYRSKSVTDWAYDTQGRVVNTTSGSLSASGELSISSNCVISYDGSTDRVTRVDCYQGSSTLEQNKKSAVEITYDLTQKKRTLIKKSLNYTSNPPTLKITEKITEEHADTEFSFALTSSLEKYDYDSIMNTEKLVELSETSTSFANNTFSTRKTTDYKIENDIRKKDTEFTCRLDTGLIKCTIDSYNDRQEVYQSTQAEFIPVMIKWNAADLFGCPSPSLCPESTYSRNRLSLISPLILSESTKGIEGKTDPFGDTPLKLNETKYTYTTPYRPWMLETASSYSSVTLNATGFYSEVRKTTTLSPSGDTITELDELRKNSGTETSRDALGDFENSDKKETVCERN